LIFFTSDLFELTDKGWLLSQPAKSTAVFHSSGIQLERTVLATDFSGVKRKIEQAKKRFGLAWEVRVLSC